MKVEIIVYYSKLENVMPNPMPNVCYDYDEALENLNIISEPDE